MLKRLFILVFINVVFSLNIAFAEEIKTKIKNISLTGLFENSNKDPYFNYDYLLPVDRITYRVDFTYGTTTFLIPFLATDVKTVFEKEGKYFYDEVKIEYYSMSFSEFYENEAILKFKGYDQDGNIMLITKVVTYREADNISIGWVLKNKIFPVDEIKFSTKYYNSNKGVPDRAWFIIHFSHSVFKP